jgi:PAS domain S-box-containing protein
MIPPDSSDASAGGDRSAGLSRFTDASPEHARLLQQFLTASPDLVSFKDRQSRYLSVSDAKARRHGLGTQDFPGKTDFDLLPEATAVAVFQDDQAIMLTGKAVIDRLESDAAESGPARWLLCTKIPMRDSDGKVVGIFCTCKDVTDSTNAQRSLENSNQQLVEATRHAGMAEVATGVLHNVGNVLTSINVTANLLSDRLRDSKISSLGKVAILMKENAADLPGFFAKDPRAAKLTGYLDNLAINLEKERQESINELATLLKSVSHVKDIIWMQQSYASVSGMVEPLLAPETIEDALKLSNNALQRHNVLVQREFADTPPARAERHKVLQILVNLISNAKKAMDAKEPSQRKLTIQTLRGPDETVVIKVIDNGIGIPRENLTKIFSHGFTTRKDGHGFGLHSSVLAATQMGGELLATSEGPGRGATFTLILPLWKDGPLNPPKPIVVEPAKAETKPIPKA